MLLHFGTLGGVQKHFPPLLRMPCGGTFSHLGHATQCPPGWLVFGLCSLLGFSAVRLSIGCISAQYAIAGFYLHFRTVHVVIFFRVYVTGFFVVCRWSSLHCCRVAFFKHFFIFIHFLFDRCFFVCYNMGVTSF